MKQNKKKIFIGHEKRKKRMQTLPYRNANKTKERRQGKGIPACPENSNGQGNFLLRISSNSPTKTHNSKEWIEIPDPSTVCIHNPL